jgi:hypothetical protein
LEQCIVSIATKPREISDALAMVLTSRRNKMLDIRCREYLDRVHKFAKENNIDDNLQKMLDYLDNYGKGNVRCVLIENVITKPYSFYFEFHNENGRTNVGGISVGGLIYDTHNSNWGVHT